MTVRSRSSGEAVRLLTIIIIGFPAGPVKPRPPKLAARVLQQMVKLVKQVPRLGTSAEERLTVGPENTVVFADARMPAVLSTPSLIAHLEYAARHALAACLTADERSVGQFIEVEHLAPVPEGFTVVCKARIIHVDGPVVTFQLEAHDGVDAVARGLHRRRVIDVDRFRKRVERKKPRG